MLVFYVLVGIVLEAGQQCSKQVVNVLGCTFLACIHWTNTHTQIQTSPNCQRPCPPFPLRPHTQGLIHMVIKSLGYLFIDVCLQSDRAGQTIC